MHTNPAFRLPLLSANQFEIVEVLNHVDRYLDHIRECYFLKVYVPVILFYHALYNVFLPFGR